MKQLAVGMVMALASLAAACANQKMPAEMALKGLEAALATAQPDIDGYAPGQFADLSTAVTGLRREFDAGNYPAVLTGVPDVSTRVSQVAAAAATTKANLAAEWTTMADLPGAVAQVTAQVTALQAMKTLPANIDKATLADASASLATATGLWHEAMDAFAHGDLATAVARAHDVQPTIATLMKQLGLTATADR